MRQLLVRTTTFVVMAISLGACAAGSGAPATSNAVAMAQALPPSDAAIVGTDLARYRLGPNDLIIITVFGAPALTREGEVDASGNFAMPLIGNVMAGGKTPAELAATISSGLRGRYVNDPQVTVSIKKAVGQMVTIDGAVREPGIYPFQRGMSLQLAIASAKGVSDLASLDRVMVFRTVRGEKMAALFSLKAIRTGRMPDPAIYPSDIVVVGESATQRFLRNLNQIPLLGAFGRFIP